MSLERIGLSYYPVGPSVELEGKTILYCNGIENNVEEASQSALLIAEAFGRKKVILCHNPTTIQEFGDGKGEQQLRERSLADSLGKKISECALKSNNEIILFVHSHGALLAKKALEKLDESIRDKVRVYSFGGVATIPSSYGNIVQNYVIDGDIFSHFGNLFIANTREFYSSTNEYKLEILPGQKFQYPEFSAIRSYSTYAEFACNILPNLASVFGNIVKIGVAVANYGIENHKFESYSNAVQMIAKRELTFK